MDGLITGKHAQNYERNAARYDSLDYKKNTFINRSISKDAIVVDFCSGTGLGIEFALHKASKVYGIEASSDMLAIAMQKFKSNKKVHLFKCEVQKTPLKNDFADVVLIRMGLHHIKDKQAVIVEAHRILKKGGKLIIVDNFSTKSGTIRNFILDCIRDISRWKVFLGHHYCTLETFKELVKEDFKIISIDSREKDNLDKANIIVQKK